MWTSFRSPVHVLSTSRDWTTLLDDPDFMVKYSTVLEQFDRYMANGSEHWFARQPRRRARRAGRLLLRRVRAPRDAADLLGRPRACSPATTARPPRTWRCRSSRSVSSTAAATSARRSTRTATRSTTTSRSSRATCRSCGSRTPRATRSSCPVEVPGRTVMAAVWLAQVGRVPAPAARHRRARQRRARPADQPHPLRARPRDAPPPGARARRRRRARAAGARHRARRVAPQRGPLRVHARRAGPRARGIGRAVRGRDRRSVRSHSVFTIHTPVPAGNERFAADMVRRIAAPVVDGSGLDLERIIEMGVGVDGDAGQFDMTAFALRTTTGCQRRQQAPRARPPNQTWASRHRAADPRHHERRPSADLGRPADARALPRHRRRPRPARGRPRGAPLLGAPRPDRRRSASGRRTWSRSRPSRSTRAAGCGASSPATARRRGRSPSSTTILDPDIMTIGFARRMATYKRAAPAVLGPRPAGAPRARRGATRSSSCSRARPIRPTDPGQGVIQRLFEQSRAEALRGPGVHPRGLRRPGRALPRAGRRRVAEQPAPAARGVGDERHEGGDERRRQRLDPRRLVGRGLRRRQRLGDRRARDEPRRGRAGLGRRAGALPAARGGGRARAGTSATRRRAAGWVARMCRSIGTTIWRFSTSRMLEEYVEQLYLPAAATGATVAQRDRRVAAGDGAALRDRR